MTKLYFPALMSAFEIPSDEHGLRQEHKDVEFYSDMQIMLHDFMPPNFNEHIESSARMFAQQYNLTYTEPQA